MELPVYNNLAEFEENYLIDYSETKDLSLAKYLKNLKDLYNNILDELDELNEFRNCSEYLFSGHSKGEIKNKIDETISKIKYESNKNLFSEWFNLLLNTPKIDIDTKINEGTFYFFETEILEITQFIDRKIEQEKTKIQILNYKSYESTIKEIETPEIDYSNTPPLERMIILEKLGIIKYIQSIQKDSKNEKETARILSSFTGINTGTVAKNLGVMLGHKKNDSDKNSPYNNPKNQQLADNKLINFNIDLTKIIK